MKQPVSEGDRHRHVVALTGVVQIKEHGGAEPAELPQGRELDQREHGDRYQRDETSQPPAGAAVAGLRRIEQQDHDGEGKDNGRDVFCRCGQSDGGAQQDAARSRRRLERGDQRGEREQQKGQRENIFLEIAGMHGDERRHGHGQGGGERERRPQHFAREQKACKHPKAAGQDGEGAAELDETLRIGQAGEPVDGAGKLEHQQRMGEIVAAFEDRVDLGGLVGVRPKREIDGVQHDADESRGDYEGEDEGKRTAQVSRTLLHACPNSPRIAPSLGAEPTSRACPLPCRAQSGTRPWCRNLRPTHAAASRQFRRRIEPLFLI